MVVGEALDFAIPNDELSLVTQKVSVVNKSDKKEARDRQGIVIAVAYYNKTSEITIEGLGETTADIGSALAVQNEGSGLAGSAFVDEVTTDYANEEFVTTTVKGTAYEGI